MLVRLTESDRGHKREGEVLRILTLCQDEVSGTLMQRGKTVYVRPASKKYPNLVIPKNRTMDARPGDRVAVKVMFRGDGRLSAQGAVTQVFGRSGTMEASIAAILHENGVIIPSRTKRCARLTPAATRSTRLRRRAAPTCVTSSSLRWTATTRATLTTPSRSNRCPMGACCSAYTSPMCPTM